MPRVGMMNPAKRTMRPLAMPVPSRSACTKKELSVTQGAHLASLMHVRVCTHAVRLHLAIKCI